MVEEAAQRGGRCLIPGDVQSQSGWDSEQLGDVSAHFREAGLDGLNSFMIMTVHVELILFNYRQL